MPCINLDNPLVWCVVGPCMERRREEGEEGASNQEKYIFFSRLSMLWIHIHSSTFPGIVSDDINYLQIFCQSFK